MSERTFRDMIVAQFGRPTGIAGWVVGWVMATRASNCQRNLRTAQLLEVRRETDRILEIRFGPGRGIEGAARLARRGVVVVPAFTEPFDRVRASNVHLFLEAPVDVLRRWLAIMRPGGADRDNAPVTQARSNGRGHGRGRRAKSPPTSALRDSPTSGSRR